MKKIFALAFILILQAALLKAQKLAGGEFIINFVDRPEEWEVTVSINAIGTHWDCDHYLTNDYSGDALEYSQDSGPIGHYSDACWDEDEFHPYLAIGKYYIRIVQPDPDYPEVWFYIDWRTSDLPPEGDEWNDQSFRYSISENKIYRTSDPNHVSVAGQTLNIWDELEDIELDTTNLEPYAPTNLTSIPWYGHPKLIWDHPELSDDYRTGYEVWRNINGWEKIVTQSPQNNLWIDWTYKLGSSDVQYKVRAINGTGVSEWSNTITLYPSFRKQGSGEIPAESLNYELYQNYPNPFNPQTTIEFSIKDNSFVTLKVFDILGKEVLTIVSELLPAGFHQVEFDGSDIESGIYFYEIHANEFRDVKKLLLLK
jgi:hypothetical protein